MFFVNTIIFHRKRHRKEISIILIESIPQVICIYSNCTEKHASTETRLVYEAGLQFDRVFAFLYILYIYIYIYIAAS